VGGLSSATLKSPSAALSLSLNRFDGRADKHSASDYPDPEACSVYPAGRKTFDRLLKQVRIVCLKQGEVAMELLTADEGTLSVRTARSTIEHVVAKKPRIPSKFTPVFDEKRGVFVTLTQKGTLRGCIGFPYPVMPLKDAIVHAAGAAALEDPRFPPVKKEELADVSIEVTILTVPVPLEGGPKDRPGQIVVGKHGLIVRGMGTSGLLLPQVAMEYGWDAKSFLDHTCIKAGLAEQCWLDSHVEILTFEGQIFSEQE
jgi:uncharacterized protein